MIYNICFSTTAQDIFIYCNDRNCNNAISILDDLSIGQIGVSDKKFPYIRQQTKKNYDQYVNNPSYLLDDLILNHYKEFSNILSTSKEDAEYIIWYSNSPFEYCGMLFTLNLMHKFNKLHCKMKKINISNIASLSKNNIYSVGEIPHILNEYYNYTEDIEYEEKVKKSELWNKLKRDNGYLRMWQDNIMSTVPKHFFDEYILAHLKGQDTISNVITELYSDIRMTQKIVVNSLFFIERILFMIDQKILKYVKSDVNLMDRIITKK